jgi:hypothetical protein
MIWADGIRKIQSVPKNKGKWKSYMMTYMTVAMSLNIGLIMSIIQLHIVGHVFYDIKFHIFSLEKLNNALSFFVLYMAVPLILNYLLIFRNNRYEKILGKYKYYNGGLFLVYSIGSIIAFFIYGIFFTPTVN